MIDIWIDNPLVKEPSGVYRLKGHKSFSYSDGIDSELYLNRVFDSCDDLSSGSLEIVKWIKDWRSEYHLSNKRANLLNSFKFDTTSNVLEVGCGCGAISRFLGETFDSVISIEGSLARADLARKRCRDLSSVHIVSAPFQDIEFKKEFDIIFCVGVLEYSNKFVRDDDPYNSIIQYFSRHLTEDGILVIAIENRLGLKYFNSASEDHTGRKFDGIEDYPGNSAKARTFGYSELQEMLAKEFGSTEFFFPFPDYKIPDAVFSQQLLDTANISGLLGKFTSRDYSRPYNPLFSEKRVWNTISENKLVPVFSNSFLIIANKGDNDRMVLDGLGVVTNTDRVASFHTRSRIYRDETSNELKIAKKAVCPDHHHDLLSVTDYDEVWHDGRTLQSVLIERASSGQHGIEFIFEPANAWYAYISALGNGTSSSGNAMDAPDLSSYYDAIWQNTVVDDGNIRLIDQEWTIRSEITPKQLLIRAIYTFLTGIRENRNVSSCLKYRSGATMIKNIGSYFGEFVSGDDLKWLIRTESSVYAAVTGKRRIYHEAGIRILLFSNITIVRYLLKIGKIVEYFVFVGQLIPRVSSRVLTTLKKRFTAS